MSAWWPGIEEELPGIRDTVRYYENLKLPPCPFCKYPDSTATVSAGLVRYSMALAGLTRKIHLIANGHPADFWCWYCKRYFDSWGRAQRVGDLLITVGRPEIWEAGGYSCFVQVENPGTKLSQEAGPYRHVYWKLRWKDRLKARWKLRRKIRDRRKARRWDPGRVFALDGDGNQYPAEQPPGEDEWLYEPVQSLFEVLDVRSPNRVQGYMTFRLPEDVRPDRVIYGSAEAPLGTWQS